MRNILVTGGSGFIGTNFIRYLLEENRFSGNIINVDKLTYAGNPENLIDFEKRFAGRFTFVRADICDLSRMREVFETHQVDTVCHFAAESHVDRSISGPGAFIQTNIVGTFNLLELARERGGHLELFHHIGTDEVFGSLDAEGFFREETPYRPNSPYSASKAASDHLVRAYHKTYGLPVTVTHCSNNYGPYQFPEKLIPLVVINALAGKMLPVYGDGKNVRDWLYVRDHCRAVWQVMQNGRRGHTYNIGGHNEMQNLQVVETICDILDEIPQHRLSMPRRELIRFVKDRPGHDRRYAIDFSKIKDTLGWMPEESFETGIRKTIAWYLEQTEWLERIKNGQYQQWIENHYGQK